MVSRLFSRFFLSKIVTFIFFLSLVSGCHVDSKKKKDDDDKSGTVKVTASDGGVVKLNDEITFTIPPESLSQDANIKIVRTSTIPGGEMDGFTPLGQAYEFSPSGTQFELSSPALLELKYNSASLEALGLDPRTVMVYYYDAETGVYTAVESSVDTLSKTVTARVEHFTLYLPVAKAMTNTPVVANQNPIPGTIRAGAPIYIRTTARDFNGSIAMVKLNYRKLQPAAGAWITVDMKRELRPNIMGTYGYLIPASFLSASDLGTGNDFEYYVTATNNLGKSATGATRRYNITTTYQSVSLVLNPAALTIAAGFSRYFTVRGVDNNAAIFQLIPETFSVTNGAGTLTQEYASGLLFKAKKALAGQTITAGFGSESGSAAVNITLGELASIEILDTNGIPFSGPLNISEGTAYNFDIYGYDEFGNLTYVVPVWSADPVIGTIDQNGRLDTTGAHGTGTVTATLGWFTDTQTVTVQSRAKDITSFSINGVSGTISDPFINLTLPYGTDRSALTASFTITGVSVEVNGAVQTSGSTANDFTSPVIYRVFAEEGSSKDYTVTVVNALNPAKDITSFMFEAANNPGIGSDVSGQISGFDIFLTAPDGSDVSSLKSTFTTTGASVTVNGTLQTSGVTVNDFRSAVVYTVHAEDGSTLDYTVKVTVPLWSPKDVPGGGVLPGNWQAIASSADGMRLAAVAREGYIYTSADGGSTWTERNGPGGRMWKSIASSADGLKLAAADFGYMLNGGYIYSSSDGGMTWVEQVSSGKRRWSTIKSSSDGSILVASVDTGSVYISYNAGSIWTEVSYPLSGVIGIAVSSDGMKIAVIRVTSNITTSIDGGISWVEQTGSGPLNWRTISSSADGLMLAVAVSGGYIYTSNDGGVTWIERAGSGSRPWKSIASSADGTKLTAATDGGYIYQSADGGITWSELTSSGSRSWSSLTSSSNGSRIASCVINGYIHTSSDSGTTWTEHTDAGARWWASIASSQDGTRIAAAANNGNVFTSNDGGETWNEQAGSGTRYWQTIATSGDGMKLAAAVSTGYVYTSDDGGTTWTEHTGSGSRSWKSIAMSSDGVRVAGAVFYGYIFTSSDRGANWTAQTGSGYRAWKSLASSSDGMKLVAGISDGKEKGYIYTSIDGGVTWVEQTGSGIRNWDSIASSSDGTRLVAVDGGEPLYTIGGYIYISSDGGLTWTEQTAAGKRKWKSVAMSSDGSIFYAAAYNDYVYSSSDGGITWFENTTAGKGLWLAVTCSADGSTLAATGYMKNILIRK